MKARPPGVTFVAAAHDEAGFPELGAPEVALIGRSNVGKSSFLNAVAGGLAVARVSRTPGRTRSVNFYRAEDPRTSAVLVDLPGYGYAQVSKEERNRWKIVIESYLSRSAVRLAILLVDGRTGATESDRMMWTWLQQHQLDTLVTVTKLDKLRRSETARAVAAVAETLGIDRALVVPFSAVTRLGAMEIWREVGARIAADGAARSGPPRSAPST